MDARNSLWATVVFLVAVVVLVPFAVYHMLRGGDSSRGTATALPDPTPLGSSGPVGNGRASNTEERLPAISDDDTAEKLQSLIDRKNEQLARQRDELKTKQAAYYALEQEYNDTLRFMEGLLVSDTDEAEAPMDDEAAIDALLEGRVPPVVRSREQLEAELRQLREQRDAAQMNEMMLTMEIEELRRRVETEMAAAQLTAQQALDDERLVREVASQALVESGEAALPVLLLLLRDERPRIRAWAADTLGAMGPRAGDAVRSLSEITDADPDQRVRESARRALRAIRD